MSISIDVKRAKTVTRLISDIATENGIKQTVIGHVDENITEEQFNEIFWYGADVSIFRESETVKLKSPVTWQEFKQRLDVELSKVDYIYNRRAEYPSVEEQLDMIFKDVDAWKEMIQAIKDKYPKA